MPLLLYHPTDNLLILEEVLMASSLSLSRVYHPIKLPHLPLGDTHRP